jgi:hypothetical protein
MADRDDFIFGLDDNRFEEEGYEKISPIPWLSGLICNMGSEVVSTGDGLVRRVKHPAASILTEDNITEKILVKTITDILNNSYKDSLWFKSQVNLWDLVPNSREPLKVLKEYRNPLQPDIDLLYCNRSGFCSILSNNSLLLNPLEISRVARHKSKHNITINGAFRNGI